MVVVPVPVRAACRLPISGYIAAVLLPPAWMPPACCCRCCWPHVAVEFLPAACRFRVAVPRRCPFRRDAVPAACRGVFCCCRGDRRRACRRCGAAAALPCRCNFHRLLSPFACCRLLVLVFGGLFAAACCRCWCLECRRRLLLLPCRHRGAAAAARRRLPRPPPPTWCCSPWCWCCTLVPLLFVRLPARLRPVFLPGGPRYLPPPRHLPAGATTTCRALFRRCSAAAACRGAACRLPRRC